MASPTGNKTTEQDILCELCGWVWPWHECPVVVMTETEEAEALGALDRHDRNGSALTDWHYSGVVTFRLPSGWEVWVFSDCGEWDYLERVAAPDGRAWNFPHRPADNSAMSDRLADWKPSNAANWVTNPNECDFDPPEPQFYKVRARPERPGGAER